jgi:hypothetical protein
VIKSNEMFNVMVMLDDDIFGKLIMIGFHNMFFETSLDRLVSLEGVGFSPRTRNFVKTLTK